MTHPCPRCHSHRVINPEAGKRTGTRIGGLSAAAFAVVNVLRGAQIGATVGVVGGPAGVFTGSITGAVLAGLFAGSAGGAVGGALGKVADTTFLDNRKCLHCGHTFRMDDDEDTGPVPSGPPVRPDPRADHMAEPGVAPHY